MFNPDLFRFFRIATLVGLTASACGMSEEGLDNPGPVVPQFPGGGAVATTPGMGGTVSVPPLAPGCTPASAGECPSASGSCATSGTASPQVKTTGTTCYYGPTTPTAPSASVEYIQEVAGGQDYFRFRVTFDPAFVDNSYGVNAIGWQNRMAGKPGMAGMAAHTFRDLVGSDHAQMQLADASGTTVMDIKIDYISEDTSRSCGHGTLGTSGGEGKVLAGNPAWILASASSIDRNLNGCGYCTSSACGSTGACTVDSPATDAKYTPNPATPNWDYRVQYEVWVASAAFGSAGFGAATISFVHASPSKAESNTITVKPGPCPRTWRGQCPTGTIQVTDQNGKTSCQTVCPEGYVKTIDEFGYTRCMPPGGGIIVG
jgi:hypothetical protein